MSGETSVISSALLHAVIEKIEQSAKVDFDLVKGGQLHIDRPSPHLCVHRRRAEDLDSEQLLYGQAAYLKSDESVEIVELVKTIAKQQADRFGSFLIIELWRGETTEEVTGAPIVPGFHVYAPQKETPNAVLDTLVNSLQRIELRTRTADVQVSYGGRCAPPGLKAILNPEEAADIGCVLLGLEIKPVYHDRSGNRLPFAFRSIHRSLTNSLRRTCYRFSHQETVSRPRHYHELGPQALTENVWDVDHRLASISEAFDLLLHVTPVNAAQAWLEFEGSGYRELPQFHYRPRSADPALLKRELYQIPLERIGDPTMAEFLGAKRDELDRQLTLLGDRDSAAFLHGSVGLFGRPGCALLETAHKTMAYTAKTPEASDSRLSALELAAAAQNNIARYKEIDPSLEARVEVRDDITGILVSHGNFLIGKDAAVAHSRLEATLNHEIGTHVLTYHNGKKQPLEQLYAGMAGYEELQEGLAVLAEYLSDGLTLPRMQLLAGRVIAVNNIYQGADFVECFQALHDECGFRPFTAYNLTMRVYRGGGYTKDLIYLQGFMKLLDYIAQGGDLELLYCGKIAIEHVHLLEELRWRKVLKPLALTPSYLVDSPSKGRLDQLKNDPSIWHILENL